MHIRRFLHLHHSQLYAASSQRKNIKLIYRISKALFDLDDDLIDCFAVAGAVSRCTSRVCVCVVQAALVRSALFPLIH